ncbi:hypothetical protein [Yersinia sp. 2105 StPb PI]|uniref:hypothetical protein n=1 Tax=Yersinia sp. 2105 StPb PI TaxID=2507058 RepID=UPI000FFBC7F7|nr:hypothetical protein [Yersinia sp. 2105 StPb PI]RXA95611.1 hypothetical protein EQP49_13240 [Yersinia sp. 2105 StPb PI]
MTYPLTTASRNKTPYRGFTINFRRRTAINLLNRYEIFLGEQSFGLFDAQAQATDYIDRLHEMRG